jgi:hypothetical protein
VYDAVWAAALALNDVDKRLQAGEVEGSSSLRDFDYDGDPRIGQLIFNSAMQRSFTGVTVRLMYFLL